MLGARRAPVVPDQSFATGLEAARLCGASTTALTSADGHHVEDAGSLIRCTYVDFRDPAERLPITTLKQGFVEATRDSGL